jgi:hypothetical protein
MMPILGHDGCCTSMRRHDAAARRNAALRESLIDESGHDTLDASMKSNGESLIDIMKSEKLQSLLCVGKSRKKDAKTSTKRGLSVLSSMMSSSDEGGTGWK